MNEKQTRDNNTNEINKLKEDTRKMAERMDIGRNKKDDKMYGEMRERER